MPIMAGTKHRAAQLRVVFDSNILYTGSASDLVKQEVAIDLYTQSPMAQRIAAQESVLNAILKQPIRRARTRTILYGPKILRHKSRRHLLRF